MVSFQHAFIAYVIGAIVFFSEPCEAQGDRYFVFTQPGTGSILYVREGDPTIRTLMMGAQIAMGPIAIDPTTSGLFVADNAIPHIIRYQLIQLPGKQLVTDGRKTIAVKGVSSQSLAFDGSGNLYIAGRAVTDVTPSAPPPPYAITQISALQLSVADPVIHVVEGVHNRANSGNPPKMFDPVALFSDGGSIYWANGKQGGSHGTICKGGSGGGGASILIDQGDSATAVGQNGEFLFYSTENGIFGTSLNKKESGCGAPAPPPPAKFNPMKGKLENQEGPCRLITAELRNTRGMFYDGDGTMYTMDPNSGIYSFPSGNLEPHRISQVAKASGLMDIQMLQVADKSFAAMDALPSVMLLIVMYLGKAPL